MKISERIKRWARIGQISYWIYLVIGSLFEMQLPMDEPIVYSNTFAEFIYASICLICAILLSEAIVRIIGFFAELLDK